MTEQSGVSKQDGDITAVHHDNMNEARRSSVTSVNLNKNVDAKYEFYVLFFICTNALCRVSNPLIGVPYETLMRDVEDFAREHDLEDIIDHLKKGALVAQDPNGFDNIEMLVEEDKQHLRFEKQHKWKHPLQLYVTIIVCSIGAAVQGW